MRNVAPTCNVPIGLEANETPSFNRILEVLLQTNQLAAFELVRDLLRRPKEIQPLLRPVFNFGEPTEEKIRPIRNYQGPLADLMYNAGFVQEALPRPVMNFDTPDSRDQTNDSGRGGDYGYRPGPCRDGGQAAGVGIEPLPPPPPMF